MHGRRLPLLPAPLPVSRLLWSTPISEEDGRWPVVLGGLLRSAVPAPYFLQASLTVASTSCNVNPEHRPQQGVHMCTNAGSRCRGLEVHILLPRFAEYVVAFLLCHGGEAHGEARCSLDTWSPMWPSPPLVSESLLTSLATEASGWRLQPGTRPKSALAQPQRLLEWGPLSLWGWGHP